MFAAQAMGRSPLERKSGGSEPVLDRADVGPIEETFDKFLKEYTILTRIALVAPDGMVVATRSRADGQSPFAVGQKIAGPLRRSGQEPSPRRASRSSSTTARSARRSWASAASPCWRRKGASPRSMSIISVARQSDAFGIDQHDPLPELRRAGRVPGGHGARGAVALGPRRAAPARGLRGHASPGTRPPRRPVVAHVGRRVRRALGAGQLPDREARRRDHRDQPDHRLGLLGQHASSAPAPSSSRRGRPSRPAPCRRSPRAWRPWTPR